jgi:hypothetical protein
MKKGQRPKQHYRRVKTKRGRRRVLVNKGVKGKRRKVKRRMAGIGKPAGRKVTFQKFKKAKVPMAKIKFPLRQPRVTAKGDDEFEMTLGGIIEAREMQERINIDALANRADAAVERALKIQEALAKADIEKTREIEEEKAAAREQTELETTQNRMARLAKKQLTDAQKALAKISVKPEEEDPGKLFGRYDFKRKMDNVKDLITKSGSSGLEKGLDKQFEELQKIANLEFTQRAVRKGKASEVDLAEALFDRGEITNKQFQEVRFREGVMSPQESKEWKAGLKMIKAPEVLGKGSTFLVSTGPEGLGPRIELDMSPKEELEEGFERLTMGQLVDRFGKEDARKIVLGEFKKAIKDVRSEEGLSKADSRKLRENIEMAESFTEDPTMEFPRFHDIGGAASKARAAEDQLEKDWGLLEASFKKEEKEEKKEEEKK